MANAKSKKSDATIIKKYANRRLYDTGRSSYVTLSDLCEMLQEGHNFIVIDAKSGDDITRSVLTQIIADNEATEENLLPTGFLRNLIKFYGDSMKSVVPNYLESTMDMFMQNQENMRDHMQKSLEQMPNAGNMGGMQNMFSPNTEMLQEMSRKNMEIFQKTMKMFSPFGLYNESPSSSSKDD